MCHPFLSSDKPTLTSRRNGPSFAQWRVFSSVIFSCRLSGLYHRDLLPTFRNSSFKNTRFSHRYTLDEGCPTSHEKHTLPLRSTSLMVFLHVRFTSPVLIFCSPILFSSPVLLSFHLDCSHRACFHSGPGVCSTSRLRLSGSSFPPVPVLFSSSSPLLIRFSFSPSSSLPHVLFSSSSPLLDSFSLFLGSW